MTASGLHLVDSIRAAREVAGHLLLGLDFDGTLAPIVPVPDDAVLLPGALPILQRLTDRADTVLAIVSGRELADLRRRVVLHGAFYAGNHGLEISGPDVDTVHPDAAAARSVLAETARHLERVLADTDGVIVEDKRLSLSVHFRLVRDAATQAAVRAAVRTACTDVPALRLTYGKQVVEVRPAVDWHKGRAMRFLRHTLRGSGDAAPAIFIGDDRTDEDAFPELGDAGTGIIVGDPPPADTTAHASLRDVAEVVEFLRRLAE